LGGGSAEDVFELYLFSSNAPGVVDLGAGPNANWATCVECLLYNEDLVGTNSKKMLFQASGVLEMSEAPGAESMPLTFYNVQLIEVTINGNEESVPVPNGKCLNLVADRIFRHGFEFE
jgi:hypothetical protein